MKYDASGYVSDLESQHTIDADGRRENLAELIGMAMEYEDADEFLQEVNLVSDTDALDNDSSVSLMTLHSAKKPRIRPNYSSVGLEDGVFPHMRSLGDTDELEEERRLAYVGIRAETNLHLSYAWKRTLLGTRSTTLSVVLLKFQKNSRRS